MRECAYVAERTGQQVDVVSWNITRPSNEHDLLQQSRQ